MPKQTDKYRLGYFARGETLDPITESRRFNAIDSQLFGLYQVFGNGVLDGWSISRSGDLENVEIIIGAGEGIIGSVNVKTLAPQRIKVSRLSTNYIYARLTESSYWDPSSLAFHSYTTLAPREAAIYIGTVEANEGGIFSINIENRTVIGIVHSIRDLLKKHRHDGIDGNPLPVDLSKEVTGVLSNENLPDIDASKIMSGKLPLDRIPLLNHENLTNIGELTHSQLDSIVEQLSKDLNINLIGEAAISNLLQLVLALKYHYNDIDENLLNHVAFIPGISSDDLIDEENTTAVVDRVAHKIKGVPGDKFEFFSRSYKSEKDFKENAVLDNTFVDGDCIKLLTTDLRAYVEDFDSVSDWTTRIADLSSNDILFSSTSLSSVDDNLINFLQTGRSGLLSLNNSVNLSFSLEKTFAQQDWSDYKRITFYIKTEDLTGGDLFFYIRDFNAGAGDSFRKIHNAKSPTINRDTLMIGWREISIDISDIPRENVVAVGFFMSTEKGWIPSSIFRLFIDDIFLSTNNIFFRNGSATIIYENNAFLDFYRIRGEGKDLNNINMRLRFANDPLDFEINPATDLHFNEVTEHGSVFSNENLYKCVEIRLDFRRVSEISSPELHKLIIDYRAVSANESLFSYSEKEHWDSGTLFNIDTESEPGAIKIERTSDIGSIIYGQNGLISKESYDSSSILYILGNLLPKSTSQIISGKGASFGQISGVTNGNRGTFWIVDTDNDKVVELDSSGRLLRGFYGSFLSPPHDAYGDEDRGVGTSGQGGDLNEEAESSEDFSDAQLRVLHSIYNNETRELFVVFNRNLDLNNFNVNLSKFFLSIKANRVYFDENTEVSPLGIDLPKYNMWNTIDNSFKSQFCFSSHVLKINLNEADSATLNSIAISTWPSIVMASPVLNEEVVGSHVDITFFVYNVTLGGAIQDHKIRYRLNNNPYQDTAQTMIQLDTDLLEGVNTIEAFLIDGNGNPLKNQESYLKSKFVFSNEASILPRIVVHSPKQSQKFPSSPVFINFEVVNFSILEEGNHLEYSINDSAFLKHKTHAPIEIQDLQHGGHKLILRLVYENGESVENSNYSEVEVLFFIGINSVSGLKLYFEKDVVTGGGQGNIDGFSYVDVANIHLINAYSPIDVQFIESETSLINPIGSPSLLIAKLRSPSWGQYLSVNLDERNQRTIFDSYFLDGHSVIQIDMNGRLLFSNNAAKFARAKEEAKVILGSAKKLSGNEVAIGDAIRNRAIVTLTDLRTQDTFVSWVYKSDRAVSDFHYIEKDEKEISIDEIHVKGDEYVRVDTSVIWANRKSIPIRIFSGKVVQSQNFSELNMSLYGKSFLSEWLNPGEKFVHVFEKLGTNHWFAFDGHQITIGTIFVSLNRISFEDEFLVVENDPTSLLFGSRVIKINSWGDVLWSFGEDWLYHPKDVRASPDGSILIST